MNISVVDRYLERYKYLRMKVDLVHYSISDYRLELDIEKNKLLVISLFDVDKLSFRLFLNALGKSSYNWSLFDKNESAYYVIFSISDEKYLLENNFYYYWKSREAYFGSEVKFQTTGKFCLPIEAKNRAVRWYLSGDLPIVIPEQVQIFQLRYFASEYLYKQTYCPLNRINYRKDYQEEYSIYGKNAFYEHSDYLDYIFDGYIISPPRNPTYFIFDTETNGLPFDYDADEKDVENWPKIVQIAYIILDEDMQIIERKSFIVRPNGFKISKESKKIHGIGNKKAKKKGVDILELLESLFKKIETVKYIIAHNINFDGKVLGAEFNRYGYQNILTECEWICTMTTSIDLCRIEGYNGGYKYPKLVELYEYLFDEEFEGAHNAENDTFATFECFVELKARSLI